MAKKEYADETEVVKLRIGKKEKKILFDAAKKAERTFAGQVRLAIKEWIDNK